MIVCITVHWLNIINLYFIVMGTQKAYLPYGKLNKIKLILKCALVYSLLLALLIKVAWKRSH